MKQYLSIEQAAAKLNVDYKTVYRKIQSGELPHVRFGRNIRIAEDELESLLEPGAAPRTRVSMRRLVIRL